MVALTDQLKQEIKRLPGAFVARLSYNTCNTKTDFIIFSKQAYVRGQS